MECTSIPTHQGTHSCCSKKSSDSCLPIVEKICRVVIAAFAMTANPPVFAISSAIGIVLGAAYTSYKIIKGEEIIQGDTRPTCGPGFFNLLGGINPPALLDVIITAWFIKTHLCGNPEFIAFCGVPLGMYFCSQAILGCWHLKNRITQNGSI
jgi:hypothetical protein